jgi:hypothetical protein
MKLILFITLLAKISFATNARSLDENCNYIQSEDSTPITYRQAVLRWLEVYENSSLDANKEKVVSTMQEAVRLFGDKIILKKDLDDMIDRNLCDFNYTSYKKYEEQFLASIRKLKYPQLYPTELSKQTVYHVEFYDINHAFSGIIRYNAHKSTGGDS